MSTSEQEMNAKLFSEFIKSRRSTRDFIRSKEIPLEVLQSVLDDAKWSPSWSNTQSYYVAVASGSKRDRISKKYCELYDTAISSMNAGLLGYLSLFILRKGLPDGDFNTIIKYPPELQERRNACGVGLYGLLGIRKEDKKARDAQTRRNFEFFDAPTAIFVFCHGSLAEYSVLDAGLFIQSLMLSAHANGLSSCAQGALATWSSPVKEEFKDSIPAGYKLVCGIAIGYASDNIVNTFNPGRIDLDKTILSDEPDTDSPSK